MSSSQSKEVIIFTTSGCSYCEKSKSILTQQNIPFVTIDAEIHNERYTKAAQETKTSTVPLLFVSSSSSSSSSNEKKKNKFIGGCSDLEQLLESSQKNTKIFEEKLFSFDDDEKEETAATSSYSYSYLLLPLTEEEKSHELQVLSKRKELEENFLNSQGIQDVQIQLRDDDSNNNAENDDAVDAVSYEELLDYFYYSSTKIPLQDTGIIFKRKKVISGKDLLEHVKKFLQTKNLKQQQQLETTAKKVASKIIFSMRMLYDTDYYALSEKENAFLEATTSKELNIESWYRFQIDNQIDLDSTIVLNGGRIACSSFFVSSEKKNQTTTITVPSTAINLSQSLWRNVDNFLGKYRSDPKDGLVDYQKIDKQSSHFKNILKLSSVLQLVDMKLFSDKEKIAFLVNTYNACCYLGFIVWGLPRSTFQKISFFSNVGVIIGGNRIEHFFSLNDIENGLLRGNRKGVTDFFSTPFSSSPEKLACCVKNVDFRIHFALNCGARSCPVSKCLSHENLENELETAARAFLQSTTSWDSEMKTLEVSQILKWYKEDFQNRTAEIVLGYLNTEMKEKILKDIGGGENISKISLSFAPYDWNFLAKIN